jgi:hypothetical protein
VQKDPQECTCARGGRVERNERFGRAGARSSDSPGKCEGSHGSQHAVAASQVVLHELQHLRRHAEQRVLDGRLQWWEGTGPGTSRTKPEQFTRTTRERSPRRGLRSCSCVAAVTECGFTTMAAWHAGMCWGWELGVKLGGAVCVRAGPSTYLPDLQQRVRLGCFSGLRAQLHGDHALQ